MSYRLSRFAVPACLLLVAAPGCSKKGAKTRASHQSLAKVPPVKAEPLSIPEPSSHADQLGHFVIDDIVGFWGGINQFVSESGESKIPDLRVLLETQIPNSEIAARLKLDLPMGCVVYDPVQYMADKSWPGVCFFSYQGGANAFVQDLGDKVKPLEPEGHRFHAQVEDKDIFVDELDNFVIVSGETTRFAASTDYIKSNIIKRQVRGAGISFDIYAADIYKRYEPLIQSQIESLTESKGTDLELMGADQTKVKENFKTVLDILRESQEFRFRLYADQDRYTVSTSQRVKDDAPVWKKLVSQGYQNSINTDLIARMPKDLAMVAASRRSSIQTDWNTQNNLIGWRWLAKLLGQDKAWAQEMLKLEQNMSQYLGEQAATGIFPNHKGPGSIIGMVQVASGVSLQEKWRAELKTLPTMNLGKAFDRNFTIKFTPKAKTEGGVVLDELKISAKEAAIKGLKASMGQKRFQSLESWLGSMSLVIHLGQVEHIAFAIATSDGADAASSKAVSALRGVDNFVLHPEFASIAKKFSGNSMAAAVDSAALGRLLQSAPLGGPKNSTAQMKGGFGESLFISRVDAKQGAVMTGSIATPLIPLVRDAIKGEGKEAVSAR